MKATRWPRTGLKRVCFPSETWVALEAGLWLFGLNEDNEVMTSVGILGFLPSVITDGDLIRSRTIRAINPRFFACVRKGAYYIKLAVSHMGIGQWAAIS